MLKATAESRGRGGRLPGSAKASGMGSQRVKAPRSGRRVTDPGNYSTRTVNMVYSFCRCLRAWIKRCVLPGLR
jgi:hypothetical protein